MNNLWIRLDLKVSPSSCSNIMQSHRAWWWGLWYRNSSQHLFRVEQFISRKQEAQSTLPTANLSKLLKRTWIADFPAAKDTLRKKMTIKEWEANHHSEFRNWIAVFLLQLPATKGLLWTLLRWIRHRLSKNKIIKSS